MISWFLLKGKCAYCNEKISMRYPIIEFLSGLIAIAVYFKIGLFIETFIVILIFILLLVLSLIDWDFRAVPDSINLLILTFAIFNDINNISNNIENALLFAGGFALLRFYISFLSNEKQWAKAILWSQEQSEQWLEVM